MKKWLAFLLCLCLTVPILPARAVQAVSSNSQMEVTRIDGVKKTQIDWAPAWAREAYLALEERLQRPTFDADGRIMPSEYLNLHYIEGAIEEISRAHFLQLLVAVVDTTVYQAELKAFPMVEERYFVDGSFRTSCNRAAAYGIVEGTVGADGYRRLNPNDPLTREQAAKMVCSLLDFYTEKLGRSLESTGSPAVYADEASISSWALPYTQRIASYGLMKGDNFGNFDPQGKLDWPAAVVLVYRLLTLTEAAMPDSSGLLLKGGEADWSNALYFSNDLDFYGYYRAGWNNYYHTIDNGDGTVSGLVVGSDAVTVERFNADGSLASSKSIEKELPIFGTFLDSGSHFYLAFGQANDKEEDNKEVWRIVQYDRDWNRLGSASVNGGDSYTTEPFSSTVSRMAVSADGKTLVLHAARQRYLTPDDGLRHQSNFTVTVNTADMTVLSVSDKFPSNHVSHSFGQFVRFDGEDLVFVDHGDAYPRSFVLHKDVQKAELLKIAGPGGEAETHAIGSGLDISKDGYLFLGCSAPQKDFSAEENAPWNVFLAYVGKTGKDVELTWLTHSETSITCARLVKVDDNRFVAMWYAGDGLHYQELDSKGQKVGEERTLPSAVMPPTDPVVIDGDICWIQVSTLAEHTAQPMLYRIDL